MTMLLEVTQYGVNTTIRKNESEARQIMATGNMFVSLSDTAFFVNVEDEMPNFIRILDEISGEIQYTEEMLYVIFVEVNNRATAEVHGTQTAIQMFEHGLGQCEIHDYETIQMV